MHLNVYYRPDDNVDKTKMTHLLSFEYDRRWHDDVDQWQFKQDRVREKHKAMLAADLEINKDPITTEYKTTIGKQQSGPFNAQ